MYTRRRAFGGVVNFCLSLLSAYFLAVFERFLLSTGRMPHPVGGAMGVTCVTAVKRGYPALTSSY